MTETGTTVAGVAGHIEELRARLALAEFSHSDLAGWVQSLLQLADMAHTNGCDVAASLASEMATALPVTIESGEATVYVDDGLTRIAETLSTQNGISARVSPGLGLAQDPELLGDFILESREHLSSIEQHLLSLEKGQDGGEAVHAIFRSFHTIKGLAGFLEFGLMQDVAHEVESLLDKVRQGSISVTPAIVDAVLESRDYLGKWLCLLETSVGSDVPADLADPRPLIARIRTSESSAVIANNASEDFGTGAAVVQSGVSRDLPGPSQHVKSDTRAVKVSTEKLDSLVDMVGEMVIAQSLIRHDPELANMQSSSLMRNVAQLARITNEVQRTAMAMRMVPVGSLFQKMARLVRDLSRKFGKQIVFETHGDDVEIDRNIVEELGDPMMHMVRNAVDHGIETEADRIAGGKSPSARITLRAFHQAGQIVIEVADDGRGIDRSRVLAKARKNGLIGPSETLSDSEALALIFQPGFSTVDNVSDISGRGVGMDVVRKQISRLRGHIETTSVVGEGTTFTLRLPLTLAIIDGLVVVVGAERFIIPLSSVRELLRPSPEMLSTIECHAEMVSIRDQLLPMVRLHERFRITPRSTNPAECVLVVADADGTSFCLMVDEMAGKQEVVIKSLGKLFQNIAGVAGGAILGDGHVGLILDLKTLFGGQARV